MSAGGNRMKIWDPSPFRQKNPHIPGYGCILIPGYGLTFWPKSHPVLFPHVHTDHWSKMKTRVPSHLVSLSPAVLMEKGLSSRVSPLPDGHGGSEQHLPQLEPIVTEASQKKPRGDKAFGASHSPTSGRVSPQSLPQYRNEYNDRAREGFRYWLIEKKVPKCYGYSFGAYKTLLGLPRV